MSKRIRITAKIAVWAGCLAPFVWLLYCGFFDPAPLGADPVAAITHTTGNWTLWLLLATLAVSPLRRLSPSLGWLARFRRLLGLFAFFYACLHLLTYVWLFSAFDLHTMVADIFKRRFITVGLLGWLVLLPLALTSTAGSIRRLGGARWRWLHRGVYVAALAGVVHYWWLVKPGVRSPLDVTLVLAALLVARLAYWRWRRRAPAPRASEGLAAVIRVAAARPRGSE